MSRVLVGFPLGLLALGAFGCFNPVPPTLTGTDSGTGPATMPSDESAGGDPGHSCSDGVLNGDETDVDCGGSCGGCGDGQGCASDEDCASMWCQGEVCQVPSCSDGILNGDEGDVDCGGSCGPCGDGSGCGGPEDCTSGVCTGEVCQAPACGDGVLNDDAEQCDGGGESVDCNDDCTPASCGDGLVNMAAGESCDDLGETASCDADCTVAECGDGVLNMAAGELCDDGGASPACDDDCTAVACGDGLANMAAGEECDGPGETAGCDVDCTLASCGDALLNPTAGEQCDDGDMIDDNLCSNACTFNACTFDTGLLPLMVHPSNFFGELDFDGSCSLVVAGGFNDAAYRVSPAGVVSALGPFGGANAVNGIAYRASDDLTYVSTNNPTELWTVDAGGATNLVMGLPGSINAIEVAPAGFGGYGDLIIGAGSTGTIYAFDPAVGSSAMVGSTGGGVSDLVFDPTTAVLYLAAYSQAEILTMDAAGVTGLFAAGMTSADGLAFDPAGTLLVARSSGSNSVTAIDIATGAQNVIANPMFDGGTYVTGLLFESGGTLLMKVSGANIDYVAVP